MALLSIKMSPTIMLKYYPFLLTAGAGFVVSSLSVNLVTLQWYSTTICLSYTLTQAKAINPQTTEAVITLDCKSAQLGQRLLETS